MTALHHKTVVTGGAVLLFLCVVAASFVGNPLLFLVPAALIFALLLLQHPQAAFSALLFSIPWSTEYQFPSGPGTDLPDEPLMLLVAASVTALLIFHRKKINRSSLHPLLWILLLQVLWLLVSVVTSSHFILSAKFFLAKSWYLLALVVAPLLLRTNEKKLRQSLFLLFVSMLAVTAVTLFRHAFSGFSFSTINDALVPFFRNHVNYSSLLVCIIPLQFLFLQSAKTKTHRRLLTLSFLITLPALYFSFARGAWLALLVGGIGYWLLQRRWLFTAYVATVIILIASVFWLKNNDRYLKFAHHYQTTIFHQDFGEHWAATYQLKDLSTAERFHRWVAGVHMAGDSWQTGFGPATFYQHYKSYTVPAFKTWVSKNSEQSTVHNYFLLLLIEQGAVGLFLFLLLLGALFWYAQKIYHGTESVFWKRTAAALSAILLMQCTVNFLSDLVETDKVGSIFYLCVAGLIIADAKAKIKTKERPLP